MPKIVNSWNEWDPLERLILGRPDGTQSGSAGTRHLFAHA